MTTMVTIILAIAGGGMLECLVLAERAFWIDLRPRARERRPDIHAILRLPVRIPVRSSDDLGKPIDESDVSFMPVFDLRAIRNADPSRVWSCMHGLYGFRGHDLSL